MKRFLTTALLLLLALAPLSAQKKAETKQYNKALSKPSVEAFDKFLKKYPHSVYAADILARKDTLLNISPYDEAQAAAIAAEQLPAGTNFRAIADRREAVDRIYAICLDGEGLGLDQVRIVTLEKRRDTWNLNGTYDAPATDAEGMAGRQFADSTLTFTVRGTRFLQFNYLLRSEDGATQTYVAACYAPQTDEFGCVSFRGQDIRKSDDEAPYRISGRSDEAVLSGMDRPWMRLMLKYIQDNPLLEQIPDNFWLTDAAIAWWLEQNPDALTSATRLRFNILQPESSLVEEFTKARGKKNSSKYSVAMFDHRGYTVIVAYQKADDNYVLAWAEPECKNHYRDRLLNSVSFDDANSLALSYYHGNRTFKYHVNLTSKTLRRR
ncbi:MAG: hypothetical protein K6E35_06445 [Bacteroidales bacterium]|nr:hypothetical protein [Bacteroidales bacterium]